MSGEVLRITPEAPYTDELEVWFAIVSPFEWSERTRPPIPKDKAPHTDLNFVHGVTMGLFVNVGGLDHAALYPTRATARKAANRLGCRRDRILKVAVPPQWGKRP